MSTSPPSPTAPPPAPVLYLDAASPVVAVGLQREADRSPVRWRQTRGEAGVDLFRAIEELLGDAKLRVDDLGSVVFCDGPGSLLGVRLVAMALRTWNAIPRQRPLRVLSYRSLALVAAQLLADGTPPPFHVISDARRATWNLLSVAADGSFDEIRRWPGNEKLPGAGFVFFPQEFPRWQPLPGAEAKPVPYPFERLPELAARYSLLRVVDEPDAFLTEMPEYRTWAGTTAAAATTTAPTTNTLPTR